MSTTLDIHFLELLTSKICHDLISPIGAVNNGVEFLEEMGADAGEEVTSLIAFSANQASAKLQAFRLAYGTGGADSNLKPEDAFKAIAGVVDPDGKIKQDWDAYGDIGHDERPTGFIKILTAGLLLAMEGLPKGGTLSVSKGDNDSTVISAQGENAALKNEVVQALSLSLSSNQLEPKYVHGHMTGLLSSHYGFTISYNQTEPDQAFNITISHG